jgi:hypothetical protein
MSVPFQGLKGVISIFEFMGVIYLCPSNLISTQNVKQKFLKSNYFRLFVQFPLRTVGKNKIGYTFYGLINA